MCHTNVTKCFQEDWKNKENIELFENYQRRNAYTEGRRQTNHTLVCRCIIWGPTRPKKPHWGLYDLGARNDFQSFYITKKQL